MSLNKRKPPPDAKNDAVDHARLLVNDSSLRSCLRAHDLLLGSVARAGLTGCVATTAALWIQNMVLKSDADVVDWSSVRQAVAASPLDVADRLPTSMAVDAKKRKQLATLFQTGETTTTTTAKKPRRKAPAKDVKAAKAALASIQTNGEEEEREPLEILQDEEDYD